MDLDEVTSDEKLKKQIQKQLNKKGVKWSNLTSQQQAKIVKGSKVAKKTIKKTMS